MSTRTYTVFLTDPNGTEHDVSERVVDLGELSESVQGEVLTEVVHDDLTVELDDADGFLADLFEAADPGDSYTVQVWRDTLQRRPQSELLFAGRLDFPWSVTFDDDKQTVALQVFANSKLLEAASAESVARSVTGRTGTISAASASMTVSSTTDIVAGDTITLTDDSNTEEFVVQVIGGPTTLTTTEPAGNSFTGAALTLDTPFYRNRSIVSLAEDLFEAAGITDYRIDTRQLVSSMPFGSRAPTDAADDWTIVNENVHAFTLEEREPLLNDFELWLLDNGVDVGIVDSFTDIIGNGYSGDFLLAYDPVNDNVWISFRRLTSGYEELLFADSGLSGITSLRAGVGSDGWGTPHFVYLDTPLVVFVAFAEPTLLVRWNAATAPLGSPPDVTLPGPVSALSVTGFDNGNRVCATYYTGAGTFVRVWTMPDGAVEGSYSVSDSSSAGSADAYDTGTEIAVFGAVLTDRFIVARQFGGLVPYADFDGLSCGGALAELALLAIAYVRVDSYRSGVFLGRSLLEPQNGYVQPLPEDPLDRERLPLTELWVGSVAVTGTDQATGEDFEVIAGDTGDSAHRLEISSVLINDAGLASAVGNGFFSLLNARRAEVNISIREPEERIAPLTRISLDGIEYDVIEARTDLEDEEQELRLVEA